MISLPMCKVSSSKISSTGIKLYSTALFESCNPTDGLTAKGADPALFVKGAKFVLEEMFSLLLQFS